MLPLYSTSECRFVSTFCAGMIVHLDLAPGIGREIGMSLRFFSSLNFQHWKGDTKCILILEASKMCIYMYKGCFTYSLVIDSHLCVG